MKESTRYIEVMNHELGKFFSEALKVSLHNPAMIYFLFRTIMRLKKAARLRRAWEGQGLHVPPYLIASITKSCNLRCKGCYAKVHQHKTEPELAIERWRDIFSEARELGISVIMIAGGEPFTRQDFLKLTVLFPEIIFPVFTNGLLLNDQVIKLLRQQRNVAPIISIEGYQRETDERRGLGTYESVQKAILKVKKSGLFFGVSITVTQENYDIVTGNDFTQSLVNAGVKVFIFVEYTPVDPSTEHLVLTDDQKTQLSKLMSEFQAKYKRLFVSFPGNEELFDGRLAAGRGFVHISPEGDFEPCPFAPYSDLNLKNISLKEALQSKLLQQIRLNHNSLTETKGGCALWTNRDWVESLLNPENKSNESKSL